MILFVTVLLNDIFEQERDYPWVRPDKCLNCGHHKVWGHGFVSRLFEGFPSPLLMKCYRCPHCGCVITLRPDTHFSRFQSPVKTIRSRLEHRIKKGKWGAPSSLISCCRHWLVNLRHNIKTYLPKTWSLGEIAAFDWFIKHGQVPVSTA